MGIHYNEVLWNLQLLNTMQVQWLLVFKAHNASQNIESSEQFGNLENREMKSVLCTYDKIAFNIKKTNAPIQKCKKCVNINDTNEITNKLSNTQPYY